MQDELNTSPDEIDRAGIAQHITSKRRRLDDGRDCKKPNYLRISELNEKTRNYLRI